MDDIQPERNPLTHKKHRKEIFWQVTFPLILGSLVVLGLAVWTILAAAADITIRKQADISLVFLIIPAMIMMLIPLAILAGIVYGVIWLNENTPGFMLRVQKVVDQVRDGVRKGSDKAVEPVIRLKSRNASFEVLKRRKNNERQL